MKMTPMNIGLFIIAIIVGLFVGLQYPTVGLVLFIPLTIFVVVILMRNKSGSLADPAATDNAKTLIPAAGKARIYVMRKGFVGGQQGMNIKIDDTHESQIRSKYFLMAEVEPGSHEVTAKMSSGTKGAAVSHTVNLKAGESVLLDMKLNMGALQGKPDFTEISDMVEAKAMLSGLKLVNWK